MDSCTVLLTPNVTDVWDTCAWMALSGKLAQVDSESYMDVAAIVSEGMTEDSLNSLLYTVRLHMWLEEPL